MEELGGRGGRRRGAGRGVGRDLERGGRGDDGGFERTLGGMVEQKVGITFELEDLNVTYYPDVDDVINLTSSTNSPVPSDTSQDYDLFFSSSLNYLSPFDYTFNNTNNTITTSFPITNTNTTHVADDLYKFPPALIVLLCLLYGLISLVAVVGNAVVMFIVATSRNMHTVTNYFIANLALADIIIGLFSIPFQVQAALLQRWNLPAFMCAFCPFFQTVSVNVSVFTLSAIAVDRYRAIVHPLSAHPSTLRSKVAIVCIWLFSLTLALPNALVSKVISKADEKTGEVIMVCQVGNHPAVTPEMMRVYSHVMVGLQFFLPLSVISFAYLRMARRLWGTRTPGNAEDARDAHVLRNKKKVIKMLFIVVALFGLCWAPLQTYNVLHYLYPDVNKYKYINVIWFACHWLAMSNSCCNPFIYAIYNEKYKREFRRKFHCFYKDETAADGSEFERSRNIMSLRMRSERQGGGSRSVRTEDTTLNGSSRVAGGRASGKASLVSNQRYPRFDDSPVSPRYSPTPPPPLNHHQEVHVCTPLISPPHLPSPSTYRAGREEGGGGRGRVEGRQGGGRWADTQL